MARRSNLPRDRIHPGGTRTQRVLDPLRTTHTQKGVFQPSNQWRTRTHPNPDTDVRQRARLLAHRLPWLPQYNFARS
jgi:hypothetical protein